MEYNWDTLIQIGEQIGLDDEKLAEFVKQASQAFERAGNVAPDSTKSDLQDVGRTVDQPDSEAGNDMNRLAEEYYKTLNEHVLVSPPVQKVLSQTGIETVQVINDGREDTVLDISYNESDDIIHEENVLDLLEDVTRDLVPDEIAVDSEFMDELNHEAILRVRHAALRQAAHPVVCHTVNSEIAAVESEQILDFESAREYSENHSLTPHEMGGIDAGLRDIVLHAACHGRADEGTLTLDSNDLHEARAQHRLSKP